MTGAVLLTYFPLSERDVAARMGARLARRFGAGRIVFVSRLRPERFAASQAIVAMLGRGENPRELDRWLSELRVAVKVGVPVAMVLLDNAAQPPAELWPNDPAVANAAMLGLSIADFDRDAERLIGLLAPHVSADAVNRIAEPPSPTAVRAKPNLRKREASSGQPSSRDPIAGSDFSVEPQERRLIDPFLPDIPDAEAALLQPSDSELDSLSQGKFPPRQVPSAREGTVEPTPSESGPSPIPTISAPAAERPPGGERMIAASPQTALWAPPLARPPAAARLPDSTPFPAAIRPLSERGFPTAPLSPVATSQNHARANPQQAAPTRSRRAVRAAALGLMIVVAGAGIAYAFRTEIAAMIDPLASNLFHRPTPPSS